MGPFEEALRRALGDSSRDAPLNQHFLRWQHSQFMKALPFLRASSFLVDAHGPTPCELAELIRHAVDVGRP